MAYAIRAYGPHLIVRGSTTTLSMVLYDLGTGDAMDLSGGVAIEVKNRSGSVISSGSASISGDGHTATYSVSSASVAEETYDDGWRVEWSTAYGIHVESAALVRTDLHCSVIAQDLLDEDPELYHAQWRDQVGAPIPWDRFIFATYKRFYSRLVTIKRWPWKIINPDGLRSYILAQALELVYSSLQTDGNDRYQVKAQAARRRADQEWDRIQLLFNEAEDGTAIETVSAQPVIYMGSAPRRRYPTPYWRY